MGLFDDEPQLSAKAREFWEKVREGDCIAELLESVLMECVYVLQRFYKIPRVEIQDQLVGLLAYKGLQNRDRLELFRCTLKSYAACSLDFVDCLLMEYERAGKGVIFGFDKNP